MFTWGWNQRGTLGHPPETKTENIPSQVKALANVNIVQVIVLLFITIALGLNVERLVFLHLCFLICSRLPLVGGTVWLSMIKAELMPGVL